VGRILTLAVVALGLAGIAPEARAAIVPPGNLGTITANPTEFRIDQTYLGTFTPFDDAYSFEITQEFFDQFPTPTIRVVLRQVFDEITGFSIGPRGYDVITGPGTAAFASVWGDVIARTVRVEINQPGIYTVRAMGLTDGNTGGRYFGSITITPIPAGAILLGSATIALLALAAGSSSIGRSGDLVDNRADPDHC